ncbi:MAG: Tic22 family protein [Cyanobacteria bacterium P01_H01_bin.119]
MQTNKTSLSRLIGLFAAVLIGPGAWSITSPSAFALPEEDVQAILGPVPVFVVTDAEGSPLVVNIPVQEGPDGSDETQAVAGVFFNLSDAQALVDRLTEERPEVGNQVTVTPISLAEVNRLDQAAQDQPDGLDFAYVPAPEQVAQATDLLASENGDFQGTPLFVARGGADGGYLTVQQDGSQRVPFFFEYQQLERLVDAFKVQNPDQADTVQIEVIRLADVINTLQTTDNQNLTNIVLVPTQETLELLREAQEEPQ